MPIYEYECKECGHKQETVQKITADPLKTCPSCNSDSYRRLIGATGFILKGSGWYQSDYKSSGKPKTSDKKQNTDAVVADKPAADKPAAASTSAAPSSASASD